MQGLGTADLRSACDARGVHLLPGAVVDVLPRRLWHPGNLHLGSSLHFCSDGRRTIEWKGRVVAEGRRPFSTHAAGQD